MLTLLTTSLHRQGGRALSQAPRPQPGAGAPVPGPPQRLHRLVRGAGWPRVPAQDVAAAPLAGAAQLSSADSPGMPQHSASPAVFKTWRAPLQTCVQSSQLGRCCQCQCRPCVSTVCSHSGGWFQLCFQLECKCLPTRRSECVPAGGGGGQERQRDGVHGGEPVPALRHPVHHAARPAGAHAPRPQRHRNQQHARPLHGALRDKPPRLHLFSDSVRAVRPLAPPANTVEVTTLQPTTLPPPTVQLETGPTPHSLRPLATSLSARLCLRSRHLVGTRAETLRRWSLVCGLI